MTAPTIEQLVARLNDAHKNERHKTRAETLYWFEQYKLLAEVAIATLSQPAQAGVAVAWIAAAGNGYEKHIVDDPTRLHQLVCELKGNGWEDVTVTPLYTTPASAAGDGDRLTGGDVYTLFGDAEVRRGQGESDMPAYIMDLARRIALAIGDRHLADRASELTAAQASGGEGGA